MTVAAEQALRTLAEEFEKEAAAGHKSKDGTAVMMERMANAHHRTADRMQAAREKREAQLRSDPSGFSYNPKGGKGGNNAGRNAQR